MTWRKNKIITLDQFMDNYSQFCVNAPLGFFSIYRKKKVKLTKDEWVELMESFRKLTVPEKMDLLYDRT